MSAIGGTSPSRSVSESFIAGPGRWISTIANCVLTRLPQPAKTPANSRCSISGGHGRCIRARRSFVLPIFGRSAVTGRVRLPLPWMRSSGAVSPLREGWSSAWPTHFRVTEFIPPGLPVLAWPRSGSRTSEVSSNSGERHFNPASRRLDANSIALPVATKAGRWPPSLTVRGERREAGSTPSKLILPAWRASEDGRAP